jgi:nitroimidazol reductase NimA-like FMN-containing flavoprotein (pyridoxamine 5'-phosphate oxidase superfamily)
MVLPRLLTTEESSTGSVSPVGVRRLGFSTLRRPGIVPLDYVVDGGTLVAGSTSSLGTCDA